MAKKKEIEEVQSRVLSVSMAGGAANVATAGTITVSGGSWQAVQLTGYWLVYNIQTIDLSGYQLQDKTLYPQGVLLQDMQTVPRALVANAVTRATMVSTTPISVSDLSILDAATGQWRLPGSMGSTHNLDNIIHGRLQYYLTLSTYSGLQQVSESTWGTGDSTAGEKLWCVDAYLMYDLDLQTIGMPDQAFVIPSIIDKEPDLEYLMRLSRSLEPVY